MKKFKNWKWQMWQVQLMGIFTLFLSIFLCRQFYKAYQEAQFAKTGYVYQGKGQEVLDYRYLQDGSALAAKFKKDFKVDDYSDEKYTVNLGRHYIVLEDSKTRRDGGFVKDQNEYYKIHFYRFDQEGSKKESIDLLKLAYERGSVGIRDVISIYSDGKDDYVGFMTKEYQILFLNLRTRKLTQKEPGEEINHGMLYELKQMNGDEGEKLEVSQGFKILQELIRFEDVQKKVKDNRIEKGPYYDALEEYGYIFLLKEDMTGQDLIDYQKQFFPRSEVSWTIEAADSKDGKQHIVESEEEYQSWIKEKK